MTREIDFRILTECGPEIEAFVRRYIFALPDTAGDDIVVVFNEHPVLKKLDDLQTDDADSVKLNDMTYGLRLAELPTPDGAPHSVLYLVAEQPTQKTVWVLVQLADVDVATFRGQLLMSDDTIRRVNKATSHVVNHLLPLEQM
jgi:hypothetical protein